MALSIDNSVLATYGEQFHKNIVQAYQLETNIPLLKVVDKFVQKSAVHSIPIIKEIPQSVSTERKRTSTTDITAKSDPFYDTSYVAVGFCKRVNKLKSHDIATILTSYDEVKSAIDPSSATIQTLTNFMEKKFNEVIWNGITGDAIEITENLEGEHSVEELKPFVNTQSIELTSEALEDSQKIIDATLTVFDQSRNSFDEESVTAKDRFFICSATLRNLLINAPQIHNSLFQSAYGVKMKTNLEALLGLEFVIHKPATTLKLDGESGTLGYFVQKDATFFGLSKDIHTDLSKNPMKKTDVQAFIDFHIGATRIKDEGIIRLELKKK